MSVNKSDKVAAKHSLSAHPMFPVAVAAWFAALFGVGSLVLPISLFESLVTGTGLSSIISAASPPLGTTARVGIAIIAALAGAGIGLFLARKVAQANAVDVPPAAKFDRKVRVIDESPTRKPISARDELGSEFLDDPVHNTPFSEQPISNKDSESPLELSDFSESDDAPFIKLAQTPPKLDEESQAAPESVVAPAATAAMQPYQPEAETQVAPESTLESDAQENDIMPNPDDTSGYNPFGARAADLSNADRPFAPNSAMQDENPAAEAQPAEQPIPRPAGQPFGQPFGMPQPADDEPKSTLAGLSMAELVDRFSASLKSRAAQVTEPAASIPLALQPLEFGDDLDDDDWNDDPSAADFPDLALGDSALDDEALENGYSSLLAMKSPFDQSSDSETESDKAVVTFPAADASPTDERPEAERRFAAPATDGPARSPQDTAQPPVQMPSRPFGSPEAPPQAPSQAAPAATSEAAPFQAKPFDAPTQNEAPQELALSEALERLQRLSRTG